MKPFFSGFRTGMLLQLAVGPVFFYIAGTAMRSGFNEALKGVAGVALVDALYIALAVAGVGLFLQRGSVKRPLSISGALVLIIFGLTFIHGAYAALPTGMADSAEPLHAGGHFIYAVILTGSSPLTIIFWTGLFSVKVAESGYGKRGLMLFGTGAVLTTLLFLGISSLIFSFAGGLMPGTVIKLLNAAVGLILIFYGLKKIIVEFKRKV